MNHTGIRARIGERRTRPQAKRRNSFDRLGFKENGWIQSHLETEKEKGVKGIRDAIGSSPIGRV